VVLGCGCGVELVVCVSVVRVGVCLWGCWWRFGGVVAGVLGGFSACGVCSRLLEMADVSSPCRQGEGGFTFTCFCELRLRGWYQCFVAPLEPKHLNLPTLPPKVAGIDTPSV